MDRRPHILVVDDDRDIRDLLREYLEKNGFRATAVASGGEARRRLARDRADLIVLDLMLLNENGLDVCRQIRATSIVPVIMLTALGEEIDRIVGLEVGADDYVAKPFSPRELVGRIRAVLRRTLYAPTQVADDSVYRFSSWRLDTTARTLSDMDGSSVALTGADYDLLLLLLRSPGRVLSRSELVEQLSGREFDPFDRTIDVRISRLRQLLGDDARSSQIIKTVYGKGYTLGVPVEKE